MKKLLVTWLQVEILLACVLLPNAAGAEIHFLDNGTVKVGIDSSKGAAITWLSWATYPSNAVNIADPGRLIQQSYYAGKALDRTDEGQSKAWSPWPWNPIQGGGVSSWARVRGFKEVSNTLFAETIPKLWDMPNEEATARMRQWTAFEGSRSNVVVVRCKLVSKRKSPDRWGPPKLLHQEIPACYFTRSFGTAKTYLGEGKWRTESQPPGPPWGGVNPPFKAMAVFNAAGQGIAIFSPASTNRWNFGPHGAGSSSDPRHSTCMHVAPLDLAPLGPNTMYSYRYWLVVGDEASIAEQLDFLWAKYSKERPYLRGS
jgi:hypothetical protein